jgi:hypothetical protein
VIGLLVLLVILYLAVLAIGAFLWLVFGTGFAFYEALKVGPKAFMRGFRKTYHGRKAH